jgi:hypothetical protein
VDAGNRCTVPDRVVVLGQARRGGSVERVESRRPCRGQLGRPMVVVAARWSTSATTAIQTREEPELLAPYQVSSPALDTLA